MNTKLIPTEKYLLLVDMQAIPDINDWIVCDDSQEPYFSVNHYKIIKTLIPRGLNDRLWKKIIAHLPLNQAPVLEGIPLLPEVKREITGYRLNGRATRQDVDRLLQYTMPWWVQGDKDIYFTKGHIGGSLVKKLKELGVFNLWFDPIYLPYEAWYNEEQFKRYCEMGEMSESHHPNCPAIDGFGCHCDELPNQKEDVQELAEQEYEKDNDFTVNNSIVESIMRDIAIDFYKRGYKAAVQEKKWSDRDMASFLAWFEQSGYYTYDDGHKKYRKTGKFLNEYSLQDLLTEYLQSLSPAPFPTNFIPEYEVKMVWTGMVSSDEGKMMKTTEVFKIINNTLQGTYL